jgi:hypothetical protein
MKRRGRKPSSPVFDSLTELLKTECQKGEVPWEIAVPGTQIKRYCYAHSAQVALRRAMSLTLTAHPCSVKEILKATNGG